jgi:hypothetical protein
MSYDYARERDEAMLDCERDFPPYEEQEEDEQMPSGPSMLYRCTDRMCGALDCPNCHPEGCQECEKDEESHEIVETANSALEI